MLSLALLVFFGYCSQLGFPGVDVINSHGKLFPELSDYVIKLCKTVPITRLRIVQCLDSCLFSVPLFGQLSRQLCNSFILLAKARDMLKAHFAHCLVVGRNLIPLLFFKRCDLVFQKLFIGGK